MLIIYIFNLNSFPIYFGDPNVRNAMIACHNMTVQHPQKRMKVRVWVSKTYVDERIEESVFCQLFVDMIYAWTLR